jgi:hypothetical protein
LKPSDSPARVLERVHRSRRKGRRERLVGDFNRLFARLSSPDKDRFIEHAIETGDKPAPTLELLEQVERRHLDLWEMLTGEVLGGLSKAKRLALQAYEADGERADEETRWRASKDGRGHARGVWTGARAGEPWFRRLQEQLELENATGDALDHFEAMAIFWSFGKDLGRYSKRRKLNLHNEKTKTFIIAEAAPGERQSAGQPAPTWFPSPWKTSACNVAFPVIGNASIGTARRCTLASWTMRTGRSTARSGRFPSPTMGEIEMALRRLSIRCCLRGSGKGFGYLRSSLRPNIVVFAPGRFGVSIGETQ